MSGILDQLLPPKKFTPNTVEEYVALQIAKRLSDECAIQRYIQLLSHFEIEEIMRAFSHASNAGDPNTAFHELLSPNQQ